jgi:hypothetical protein
MNHSGDAAEQIVRMSLEGVEVAAKITGAAAKEIAVFLIAALKSGDDGKGRLKLKGRARLESMLKSGKALEIFSVKNTDLQKFAEGAKQYGIVYCVLRDKKPGPDGLCDIMVKADDAPKINRLVERFKFATVDRAKIERGIEADKAGMTQETESDEPDIFDIGNLLDDLLGPDDGKAEPDMPDTDDIENLLDDLLGVDGGKTGPDDPDAPDTPDREKTVPAKTRRERNAPEAPAAAKPAKEAAERDPLAESGPPTSPPSEPTSEKERKPARDISSRPSVKAELNEIKAARRAKESEIAKRDGLARAKPKNTPATAHKQPGNNRKHKSKKSKAR